MNKETEKMVLDLLALPADASDETIQNRVGEVDLQAAEDAKRLTGCGQLANAHKELRKNYELLLNAQVETDLLKYAKVIPDKEKAKAALLKNRDAMIEAWEGALKATGQKPQPLYDPAKAPGPKPVTDGEPNAMEAAHAARVRNRASELALKNRMQFDIAWRQAAKELKTEQAPA